MQDQLPFKKKLVFFDNETGVLKSQYIGVDNHYLNVGIANTTMMILSKK